jgi:hypothetical protein
MILFKDFRGNQLKAEYLPTQGEDQFKSHFDIAENNKRRLGTSYQNHFYAKHNDKVCIFLLIYFKL